MASFPTGVYCGPFGPGLWAVFVNPAHACFVDLPANSEFSGGRRGNRESGESADAAQYLCRPAHRGGRQHDGTGDLSGVNDGYDGAAHTGVVGGGVFCPERGTLRLLVGLKSFEWILEKARCSGASCSSKSSTISRMMPPRSRERIATPSWSRRVRKAFRQSRNILSTVVLPKVGGLIAAIFVLDEQGCVVPGVSRKGSPEPITD